MMSDNGRDQLMVEDATVIAKALTRIAAWLDLSDQELRAIVGQQTTTTFLNRWRPAKPPRQTPYSLSGYTRC